MTQPSTLAVLGGGYAGLFAAQRAARAAARARGPAVRVVLIDADDAWTERTRWHQIAAGETVRSRPRARMLRGTGVENITATAAGIDLGAHTVTFTGGQQAPLPFDRLVYAAGSRSSARLSFISASVGQHHAVVQLLQPDGTPRRQMLTGRPAHWMKEAIEHYVTFAARAERTLPGIYHWAPAAKK